ncbi:hypothetical protein MKW98_003803 [Papaver atlanticum]|uniref:SAWADEE domain-containing protein n=1 Tax=Papaver atlanticum TaxID=357466 RepID=A0AAD4T827_9MAGN|nr:hypothetical protein MKW98_003803 [Papaver atlanticum]
MKSSGITGKKKGKPNHNPLLDFRSTHDDAWYSVGKLVLSKRNTILTVKFADFDEDKDEGFSVDEFKTVEELDDFVNRFRPACVQLQDEECYDWRRGSNVCALLVQDDEEHKFYNGVIESIDREPHTQKGGEESCSCASVVGWLEGPNANCTEQMGIERMCKLQPGSSLFDQALVCFVKMSRAQLDLDSNDIQLPAKKVKVLSQVQRRSCNFSVESSIEKSDSTSAKSIRQSCRVLRNSKEATSVKFQEGLSRVQRRRLIGSSLPIKSSVAKFDSTPAKSFGRSCGVHTNSKEPTLAEKMFQGNSVMNAEAAGKDTGLGGISMAPEVLNKVDDPYRCRAATLVEKMIQGNSVMNTEVAGKDTGLGGMATIPEVLNKVDGPYHILICLSSDPSTRGIIVADTKEKINELLNYLHNPDHLIVSSRGRPWVTSDTEPKEGAFGNLWAGDEVVRGPELRAVRRGTDEFTMAKQIVEIFKNSANRIQCIHESVASEMEQVLLQYSTRSRKKLKAASEHNRMNS